MYISKVELHNFRSHKNTLIELSETNVLIGQNNTGKTAFLDAVNHAIGRRKGVPSEDDFYASEDKFDPKNSDPIRIILEFRETKDNRFSDNVSYIFDKAIQFDEEQYPDDPIKYLRMCYEVKYDKERDRYVDERYFVDINNKKLPKDSVVKRNHSSFFPFFYLTTLRDINTEIKNKSSFWGKLKASIDYKDKEKDIKQLIEQLNDLLLADNVTVNELISKLKELEHSVRITPNSIYLQAFSKRSWELLDELNIYLKTANSNLALPIAKHGMGTQNIAILLIFNVYLDILLPKIVENEEATPIIGIEEPEAHIHPQAQRAVFQQISNMKGQKIISTHSPFIVDQANIYDYLVFNTENGTTKIEKIPKYNKKFKFKYGLPEEAYNSNKYLMPDEELLIQRYTQYRNAELFFSSLFILCEGDTEKVFLERIFLYDTGKTPGQLGISVISCEGQTYSPFLKIANSDAFNLNWLILSDAERDTKKKLKNTIENSGYEFNDEVDKVSYLPDGKDFEGYYIDFYGIGKIKEVISYNYGHKAFDIFKNELSKQLSLKDEKYKDKTSISDFSEKELINIFIDRKGKPKFAEQLALYVIENELLIPDIIRNLIEKAVREVEK
ncbi:hypothetical protein ES705_09266 [subsurface metagenome]